MDGPSVGDKSASSFEKSRDPRSVPSIKKANARSILSCLYVFQIRVWNVEQILARNLRNEIPFFRKKKFARQTFERILSSLHFTSSTVRRESRREILGKIQIHGGEKGWVVEHNFRRSERKRESGVIAREEGKVCPKRGRGEGKKVDSWREIEETFFYSCRKKKRERERVKGGGRLRTIERVFRNTRVLITHRA